MIVVDTTIISYFYLNSDYSELAEKTFKKDPIWSIPLLWKSEFRNVLTFYMRKKIITLSEATEIFAYAEDLLKENEYEINSMQVLSLSHSSDCPAYDCEFVNLAQDLDVLLVTQDKKVLRNFPETAISMRQFVETH
jgi:predicted nucleic acid-binding protein